MLVTLSRSMTLTLHGTGEAEHHSKRHADETFSRSRHVGRGHQTLCMHLIIRYSPKVRTESASYNCNRMECDQVHPAVVLLLFALPYRAEAEHYFSLIEDIFMSWKFISRNI